MSFNVISMFSGAGGLDMGFHNKGFRVLWANDFNRDACDTYDRWANYAPDGSRKPEGDCTVIQCGDISKVDFGQVAPGQKVDVVLGGFPCQGFSLAGPRQVDDSRNVLYRHFVEMVRVKNPSVIIAENVIGIKTLGGGAVFRKIIEDFGALGYTMSAPTVNAKDYGVPQDRMRVIFIGIKEELSGGGAYYWPEGEVKSVTIRDVLEDLEEVDMDDVCQAPFSSRYMSRNRQRGWDDVSFTIPAMAKQVALSPDSEGMRYVGVDRFEFIGTYNRRLSYKEAAAIQTFPPGMEFCGDLDSRYKQIGNAVPVKLAEVIAEHVKRILTTDDLSPCLNMDNPEKEIEADRRITSTVLNGKAFEYAIMVECYNILNENGWDSGQLVMQNDSNYENIARAYEQVCPEEEQEEGGEEEQPSDYTGNTFRLAAHEAAAYIYGAEPILQQPDKLHAVLRAVPDSAGIKGDVRDIIITLYNSDGGQAGEIGISCKNNNEAVKHPRITEDADFVKTWTGMECSGTFLEEMKMIQDRIEQYAQVYQKWSEVEDKTEKIYEPVITSFIKEIKRLAIVKETASEAKKRKAEEFARRFFAYLFGKEDFYKCIKDDHARATKVYPYNMYGGLMKEYQGVTNPGRVKSNMLPDEIVEVRLKPGSKTTLEIFFDQWIVTMRLHNADSRIKRTSLKFDVQIKAQPRKIVAKVLRWESN